jgi:hypothetical protein
VLAQIAQQGITAAVIIMPGNHTHLWIFYDRPYAEPISLYAATLESTGAWCTAVILIIPQYAEIGSSLPVTLKSQGDTKYSESYIRSGFLLTEDGRRKTNVRRLPSSVFRQTRNTIVIRCTKNALDRALARSLPSGRRSAQLRSPVLGAAAGGWGASCDRLRSAGPY